MSEKIIKVKRCDEYAVCICCDKDNAIHESIYEVRVGRKFESGSSTSGFRLCETCANELLKNISDEMTGVDILSLFHGTSKTMQKSVIEILKVTQGRKEMDNGHS